MGLTNTVEASSCVQTLASNSTPCIMREYCRLPISFSSFNMRITFNNWGVFSCTKPAVLVCGVSIDHKKCSGNPFSLCCWVQHCCTTQTFSEALGFAVDKLFNRWLFILALVFYCTVLGGGGVMESRQGWKAGARSALHRQLQWAQNPRIFTFSNWMTL